MAKDFAFMFKPGDYLRDTQCLSEKCQVAYDRIMCEHMRNICITQEQLNFFTKRLNDDEKKELLHMIKIIEGGFEIEWVAESIRERINYSESRRKNRNSKKKNISQSYDPHMEGEGDNEDKSNNYKKVLAKVLIENNIILPTGFEPLILEWLKYKSEKNQTYKETGLKKLIMVFLEDSGSDLTIAQEMLDYSMSKNYTGLFKDKSNGSDRRINQRTGERTDKLWDQQN